MAGVLLGPVLLVQEDEARQGSFLASHSNQTVDVPTIPLQSTQLFWSDLRLIPLLI